MTLKKNSTEEDIHDDQLTEASVEEDMPPDRKMNDEEESTGWKTKIRYLINLMRTKIVVNRS